MNFSATGGASQVVKQTSAGGIFTVGTVANTDISGLGANVATWLGTPSSANLAAAVTDETGTGALVFANTPTLVTPVLGAATATSINGLTISSSTGTFTLTNGKTFAVSNSLTLAGTDSTTITFQGTDTYVGRDTTDTLTHKTFNTASTGNSLLVNSNAINAFTGTGSTIVLATSPSLTTPSLGAATATTMNVGGGGALSNTTLLVSGNATSTSGAQSGTTTYIHIASADATIGGMEFDGFGNFPFFGMRRSEGTAASKTAVASASIIGNIAFLGYTGTTFASKADITASATENWSGTANGTQIVFATTPNTTTTKTNALYVLNSGGVSIGASTDPGAGGLYVNGATITLNGLATDATHTDRTVCQDTTSKSLFFGSGAAGICLGTSSRRFKQDIVDAKTGVADLMRLRPVNFHYLPGYGGEQLQFGFIAEEVIDVIPALVGLNVEGQPNSVDMMAMVPILVRAIQELKGEVDSLSTRTGLLNAGSSTGTAVDSTRP